MSRVWIRTLVLTVAAALALAPAAAAKWVVHGRGFGHGVGLSAYGAYGYGKHGRGYQESSTTTFAAYALSELRHARLVRVLLSISPSDVRFTKATTACRRELNPSRTYRAHRSGSSVRLLSRKGRRLARCGKRLQASGDGRIRIGGVGTYRGALKVVPTASVPGSLNVINKLTGKRLRQGIRPGRGSPHLADGDAEGDGGRGTFDRTLHGRPRPWLRSLRGHPDAGVWRDQAGDGANEQGGAGDPQPGGHLPSPDRSDDLLLVFRRADGVEVPRRAAGALSEERQGSIRLLLASSPVDPPLLAGADGRQAGTATSAASSGGSR